LKPSSRNCETNLCSSRKASSRHTSSTVREASGRVPPSCGGCALLQTLVRKTVWHSLEATQGSPDTESCMDPQSTR
jgi:hypothetical protein